MGEFKPLGVWGALGYDVEAIEKLSDPTNVRHHNVLGKTYRVVICAHGSRNSSGMELTSGGSASSAAPAAPSMKALVDVAPLSAAEISKQLEAANKKEKAEKALAAAQTKSAALVTKANVKKVQHVRQMIANLQILRTPETMTAGILPLHDWLFHGIGNWP